MVEERKVSFATDTKPGREEERKTSLMIDTGDQDSDSNNSNDSDRDSRNDSSSDEDDDSDSDSEERGPATYNEDDTDIGIKVYSDPVTRP